VVTCDAKLPACISFFWRVSDAIYANIRIASEYRDMHLPFDLRFDRYNRPGRNSISILRRLKCLPKARKVLRMSYSPLISFVEPWRRVQNRKVRSEKHVDWGRGHSLFLLRVEPGDPRNRGQYLTGELCY
jgi:hypothetical protein